MKVFLTGGTGFLGSRLTPALVKVAGSVTGLAIGSEDERLLKTYGAGAVRGDLADAETLAELMQGCDTVVHAAALMDVWGDERAFYRVNVEGTRNMLRAAQQSGIRRFVYVSAASVVLGAGDVEGDEALPRQLARHCSYSRTKSIAEEMVLGANTSQLMTLALRPPMIWGAGDKATIPGLIEAINAKQFAWIGGGRNRYSTCHVANVAEAVTCALSQGQGGRAYFVTDGPARPYREVVEGLLKPFNVVPGNREIPRWAANAAAAVMEWTWAMDGGPGRPPLTRSLIMLMAHRFIVNDEKARSELGYRGKMSIADGLTELASWAAASEAATSTTLRKVS